MTMRAEDRELARAIRKRDRDESWKQGWGWGFLCGIAFMCAWVAMAVVGR